MNVPLIISGIIGFISVAFGAYAEHGLRPHITGKQFEVLQVAIRYHQTYSILLLVLALSLFLKFDEQILKRLKLVFYSFFGAISVFSFSIYLSVITGIKDLTHITPIGGVWLMISWLMLVWVALSRKS
jgi:uncharacterized membrane protein YgdD (TMEM256/DUF423 family)